MNYLIELFDIIGLNGPFILFAVSIYYLYSVLPYLYAFLVCSVLNFFINNGLKEFIREPRPKSPISYYDDTTIVGTQVFGMPSGHAQSVFFSTIFVYLTTKSVSILLFFGFISAVTIYQRFRYKRHTAKQLVVGSLIGGFVGYICFYITKCYLERYKANNRIL